jgi:hypothetical protein
MKVTSCPSDLWAFSGRSRPFAISILGLDYATSSSSSKDNADIHGIQNEDSLCLLEDICYGVQLLCACSCACLFCLILQCLQNLLSALVSNFWTPQSQKMFTQFKQNRAGEEVNNNTPPPFIFVLILKTKLLRFYVFKLRYCSIVILIR